VAIVREPTVAITYGTIKFVSGVLTGEEFAVEPEGAYIGREPSLSQIVVSDPRISKRHLWVGVRDGVVTVVDQESRNGTFINDPRSERIHEAKLNSGDTVIMGESDVARFEYHS
jgi:predicted component of type VI protein secretion system